MDEDRLFSDVRFVLASECDNAEDIKNILIKRGAKHINYLSEHVTHVIADSNCLEAEEAVELYDKPVVTTLWVHLSLKANKLLPPEAFSPTKRYFHSVVTLFSKDLSQKDIDSLAAAVTFYGGNLTKNLDSATHFIAISSNPSDSPLEKTHLKIVAPDWILDSIKQKGRCDESYYEPGLLRGPPPPTPPPPPEPEPAEEPVQKEVETTRPSASQSEDDSQKSNFNSPSKQAQTNPNNHLIPSQRQPQSTQLQSQPPSIQQQQQSQYQQQEQPQTAQQIQPSHIPRPRMAANIIRGGSQPRFRPVLPPQNANMPNPQRPMRQPNRLMSPEHQQPMKPNIYTQNHRKVGPYQNSMDVQQQQHQLQQPPQHMHQQQSQQIPQQHIPQPYQSQHVPPHQQGNMMNQPPSRIPQPNNAYHQVRAPHPNNHMPPRVGMGPQPGMMAQGPQPMMNQAQQQPPQMNRFQDPNNQMPQRPYQVCPQPPQVNPNYQQGNIHRQQMYYTQNNNQSQMRMPQPGPMMRPPMQPEQVMHDGQVYVQQPQQHPPHDPMQAALHHPAQQHYQISHPHHGYQQHPQQQQQQQQPMPAQPPIHQYQTPQQTLHQSPQHHHHHHHQQQQQQQQQQHSPQLQHQPPPANVVMQPNRPPFHQPGIAPSALAGSSLRPPRITLSNSHEPRNMGPRCLQPPGTGPQIRGPRASNSHSQPQPQPHPSIFDNKLESSLAQMKAKVPTLTDNIQYFGYDPKETVPKNKPFIGCKFKLIEYTEINVKLMNRWCDIIKQAGGTFFDDLSDITHLICETRLTDSYSNALAKGIRCVTIYWINDVLATNNLSFPWKPLHIPMPYDKDKKSLNGEMISITNFKGKERLELREMIKNTGAKFTDHFSNMNTLLICAERKGEKYRKAIEWKIPVVNWSFLADIILEKDKDVGVMVKQSKYTIVNAGDGVKINSYETIRDVMAAWTKQLPVPIKKEVNQTSESNGTPTKESNHVLNTNEDSGMATGGSNNSEMDPSKNTAQNDAEKINDEAKSPVVTRQEPEEKAEPSNPDADLNMFEPNSSDLKTADDIMQTYEKSEPTDKNTDLNTSTEIQMETDNNEHTDLTSPTKVDHATTDAISRDETTNKETVGDNTDSAEVPKQATKPLRESTEPIRVLFTHMDSELRSQLQSCTMKLGLAMASSPIDCTHLVVDRISRTPKFICAFSHASYILSHKWLLESDELGQLLDEKQFILQDSKGEEQFSFNLVYSLLKRKKRSCLLFSNLVFFVTPTVLAKVKCIKEMIESAGGIIFTRKPPTRAQIDQMRTNGKRLVVVSNQQDLYLCSSLRSPEVAIVGYEFVISGILRQDIDFDSHRVKISSLTEQSETSLARVSSPKRVRTE